MPFYKKRATRQKSIVKTVKNVLNRALESKHTDRSVVYSTYGDTGSVYNLTAIAGGSGEDQRVGEKVTVQSVRVTGTCIPNSAGNANQFMRMIIFRDNMPDGNIPTCTQLLESTGNARIVVSNYNLDYHKRYTVLKDCFVNMALGQKGVRVSCSSFKKTPVWYTGALATDEGKGQIYLALMSDANVQLPQLQFTSRVMYKDA